MSADAATFWKADTSVFFTSFWGWTPETWGTVGWTGDQGLTHRTHLLKQVSDPFVAVIYVTKSADHVEDRGMVVGFYLMSHETGHRNEFTHPIHHDLAPEKWEHSLRALRAFTYLPEYRLEAAELHPDLSSRAQAISKWGEILTDPQQIEKLRGTPWVETAVYSPHAPISDDEEMFRSHADDGIESSGGYNRAGPANRGGYTVSSNAHALSRQLYILRLEGKTDDFLGETANGRRIYKVGVSVSPELRRQAFQNSMPRGAFEWIVFRASGHGDAKTGVSFDAAVEGEYAMKEHLATCGTWLGGEFYLAYETDVKEAWHRGIKIARAY